MRKAADEFLWDGRRYMSASKHEYVSDAVLYAAETLGATDHSGFGTYLQRLVRDAGLTNFRLTPPTGSNLISMPFGEQSQSARFMFLHLLALVLKEEGQ